MADSPALVMLQVDLGYLNPPDQVKTFMNHCLSAATTELQRKGVMLDSSDPADTHLLVLYAAWLYRKRDTGAGMPRMLEYALRNAQVHKTLAPDEEADA